MCGLVVLLCFSFSLFAGGQDSWNLTAIKNIKVGNVGSTAETSGTTDPLRITTDVVPTPTVPVYNVTNGTDICLYIQMNVRLNIAYYNKQGVLVWKTFNLNSTTHYPQVVSGSCGVDMETVRILWWPNVSEPVSPVWGLEFFFKRLPLDNTEGQFTLDKVLFNYTVTNDLFPDTNETTTHVMSVQEQQFKAPIGSYFQCMSRQTWKLNDVTNVTANRTKTDALLMVSNLRAEAFRTGSNKTFVGQKSECSADFVPNKVVPIVIGVALAAMIVIALVTFIIGSRRRQAGYQEI
ncbi:Lysosome-associated membrane glycoprotein [Fasciola hepatica]|uniref:Lysosome-associated membrane glycoprotein 5 n=1 Tax=Fasciola hepatica TaxID=6192 RepID=A0A4E0R7N2_FASHE|nr:Lysosome-associated membrane glycoprotein [Fasciola hepatica]